ncbi:MAG: hypothetical protein RIQ47_472 [Bacteroidota bacterium]|jgi:hypothetical protein
METTQHPGMLSLQFCDFLTIKNTVIDSYVYQQKCGIGHKVILHTFDFELKSDKTIIRC